MMMRGLKKWCGGEEGEPVKQKIFGTYNLGGEPVQVALREGTGGDWETRTQENRMAILRVSGDDPDNWPGMVGVLLHEAEEFVASRMGLRFRPSPDFSGDNGSYTFLMTHTEYSELTARVGLFMAVCLPDLARAWGQWGRAKK